MVCEQEYIIYVYNINIDAKYELKKNTHGIFFFFFNNNYILNFN